MAILKRRLNQLADDSGAELIELAAALPILLLIVAGIADFGFVFKNYEVVTAAAREGARVAALPGYTLADVQARVQHYLAAGGVTCPLTCTTLAYSDDTLAGLPGVTVRVAKVTVVYPNNLLILSPVSALVGGHGYGTISLTAVSAMRVEAGTGS